MTEIEIRNQIASFAEECAKSGKIITGSEELQELIDEYNKYRPLARNLEYSYKLGGWCELFADVCYIHNDAASIITPEIGPWEAIQAAKKAGIWKPKGTYIPKRADKIYYYYTTKDEKGNVVDAWYHVGIVTNADDSVIYSTEGNIQGRVLMLSHKPTDKTIVGYIAPDFSPLVSEDILVRIPAPPKANGTYNFTAVVSNKKFDLKWTKK